MVALVVAGTFAALAVAALAPRLLPRAALIALGLVIVALGCGAVAYVEWRYAPERTLPVQMPVSLAAAGMVQTPSFRVAVAGTYDLWLEFERHQDAPDFACLTGDDGAEAVCPRRDPDLAVAWTIAAGGAAVARGATDWSGWHARQAALDPAKAARRRKAYLAYQARSLDPANNWPLYYRLGSFAAESGRAYVATLTVGKPAGVLATLRPRLAIGLGGGATKGLGAMALVFCLFCVLTGAALLLQAIPRGKRAAP
ncbi:MAG TPA: hypothetical protein VNU97_09215 [Rhizomicrobium sp.]|jgi:hypothetical protein|nr:hypothetical protein [Rhizomicrobium sp.]